MPILCLEGPSAVGKTTAARALAALDGAHVVPEVNALFERPGNEPATWYLERQADRWALAADAARRHALVVLDGDPFQPLWYNWAYSFVGWQGLDALVAFYRPRLVRGEMGFPDCYVVLGAPDDTLRERQRADRTRRRRGFEAHLQFVDPQRRYVEALRAHAPLRACFVDARTEAETLAAVRSAARSAARTARPEPRPVALFDHLVAWLRDHPAA